MYIQIPCLVRFNLGAAGAADAIFVDMTCMTCMKTLVTTVQVDTCTLVQCTKNSAQASAQAPVSPVSAVLEYGYMGDTLEYI